MCRAGSHPKPGLIDVEVQIHTLRLRKRQDLEAGGGGEYTAGPLADVRPEPHTFEVVARQSDRRKQQAPRNHKPPETKRTAWRGPAQLHELYFSDLKTAGFGFQLWWLYALVDNSGNVSRKLSKENLLGRTTEGPGLQS